MSAPGGEDDGLQLGAELGAEWHYLRLELLVDGLLSLSARGADDPREVAALLARAGVRPGESEVDLATCVAARVVLVLLTGAAPDEPAARRIWAAFKRHRVGGRG